MRGMALPNPTPAKPAFSADPAIEPPKTPQPTRKPVIVRLINNLPIRKRDVVIIADR